MDKQVTVTGLVAEGIRQALDNANVNMFDFPVVCEWLYSEGYYHARDWIMDYPETFARLILNGMVVGEVSDTDS